MKYLKIIMGSDLKPEERKVILDEFKVLIDRGLIWKSFILNTIDELGNEPGLWNNCYFVLDGNSLIGYLKTRDNYLIEVFVIPGRFENLLWEIGAYIFVKRLKDYSFREAILHQTISSRIKHIFSRLVKGDAEGGPAYPQGKTKDIPLSKEEIEKFLEIQKKRVEKYLRRYQLPEAPLRAAGSPLGGETSSLGGSLRHLRRVIYEKLFYPSDNRGGGQQKSRTIDDVKKSQEEELRLLKLSIEMLTGENKEKISKLLPVMRKIDSFEKDLIKLSDVQLKAKTEEFKARFKNGRTFNNLLPEAFAVVREAFLRLSGKRLGRGMGLKSFYLDFFDRDKMLGIAGKQDRINEIAHKLRNPLAARAPISAGFILIADPFGRISCDYPAGFSYNVDCPFGRWFFEGKRHNCQPFKVLNFIFQYFQLFQYLAIHLPPPGIIFTLEILERIC